ncbi:MAG TPA: twin-arginine translocation signal domain-containing protein [Candidatus Paceibacterota bacterium]
MREAFSHEPYHPRGKPDFLRDEPPFPVRQRNDRSAKGYEVPRRVPVTLIQDGKAAERFDKIRAQANAERWSEEEVMRRMDKEGFTDKGREQLTRRKFLQMGAAAVAAPALGALDYSGGYTKLGRFLNDTFEGQYNYDEFVADSKKFLKERYGVELIMGGTGEVDPSTAIHGDPVTIEHYRKTLKVVVKEMQRYQPPTIVRDMLLPHAPRIRIAINMKVAVREGDALRKVLVGGAAPLIAFGGTHSEIGIDASEDESYIARTVHHEINHKLVRKSDFRNLEQSWTALHSTITSKPYPERGKYERQPGSNDRPSSERYFLTAHAKINPFEDMAVCAEYMLTPLLHVEFIERWRNERDPKVKAILAKKYIQTQYNYEKWSGGKMNQAYWAKIKQEGYAERKRLQSSKADKLQGRVGQP